MPVWKWSTQSLQYLGTCDEQLQAVVNRALAISPHDIKVVEGYRTPARQAELFAKGDSKVRVSKHNSYPSLAVDIAPLTSDGAIPWNDRRYWFMLAGVMYSIASDFNLEGRLRWGGDWDGDTDYDDQTFNDYLHWELKKG